MNISLSKQICKHSKDRAKDKIVRLQYFVKIACYCCIVAILIMTCVLLYQVYLILNCMERAVILAL